MNELNCEGCIWENDDDQDNCNNCIRIQDAPFNDGEKLGHGSTASDNYESV